MTSLLIIGTGNFSPEVEELAGLLGYSDIAIFDDNPSTAYCSPVIETTADIAYSDHSAIQRLLLLEIIALG